MTAAAFAALAAIFILIALGTALRRADTIGDAGWQTVERLTHVLFLPALLVQSIAGVRLPAGEVLRFALCLGTGVLAITVGMFALHRSITPDARQFGAAAARAVVPCLSRRLRNCSSCPRSPSRSAARSRCRRPR